MFGIDVKKINKLVADHASNMGKLARILEINYFGCFCFSKINIIYQEDDLLNFDKEPEEGYEIESESSDEGGTDSEESLSTKEKTINIDTHFFDTTEQTISPNYVKTLKLLFQ